MLPGMFALAIFRVGEPNGRRHIQARRAIIAHVGPQSCRLGLAHPRRQNRYRRIIGMDLVCCQHMLANLIDQGSQQMAGGAHPVGQCGAIQIDALPGKDLRLAIQRKVVSILRDQHMRQQIRSGKSAFDGS